MPTLDKTIKQLNLLLRTCHDGQRTCEQCAQMAQAPLYKQLFTGRGLEWAAAGEQLQRLVQTYGGRPSRHASLEGLLQRGVQRAVSAVAGTSDEALLEECLRFDAEAGRCYQDVAQQPLPPWVDLHIHEQQARIEGWQVEARAILVDAAPVARRD